MHALALYRKSLLTIVLGYVKGTVLFSENQKHKLSETIYLIAYARLGRNAVLILVLQGALKESHNVIECIVCFFSNISESLLCFHRCFQVLRPLYR